MNRIGSNGLFARDITGTITANRQQVEVDWRAGTLSIDEPKFNGGQDLGPDPFTMIVAGLVGCTLTTLRMYVRRKGWHIDDIRVDANIVLQEEPFRSEVDDGGTVIVKASIGRRS
jgi:putative redox protein